MPTATETKVIRFSTLHDATRRYRLRDPNTTNAELAGHLDTRNEPADYLGVPFCCFFSRSGGYLAAIRTEQDVVAVFHLYQATQAKLKEIADRIE